MKLQGIFYISVLRKSVVSVARFVYIPGGQQPAGNCPCLQRRNARARKLLPTGLLREVQHAKAMVPLGNQSAQDVVLQITFVGK